MPWERRGNKIYKKENGKWIIKQRCQNTETAKAALRLLYGVEGGKWKPTQRK